MKVWIGTDMEGLTGINTWEQCNDPDDNSPAYRNGLMQLNLDVNAAAAGCFDAGADAVYVCDGHGRNQGKGLLEGLIDPRITQVRFTQLNPMRLEQLCETIDCIMMIGQHAKVGTQYAFIDHTQMTKQICSFKINGVEHGESSQFMLYAGHYNLPLVFASGDEALCTEIAQIAPHALTVPTKKGLGWMRCELYPADEVRKNIRETAAKSLELSSTAPAWKLDLPIDVQLRWAWSQPADDMEQVPGVRRLDAHTLAWKIEDARDIYAFPSEAWQPMQQ